MNKKKAILTLILSAAMLISPLSGLVAATNPYTDPTAISFHATKSFSAANIMQGNHTYTPTDKVANPVQKLVISFDEKLLACDISVNGVTYSLGKDFNYTGYVEYVYYNPSFTNPVFGYLYPSAFSSSEANVEFMYDFSVVPGGLEGTIKMIARVRDDVTSVSSVEGTGDFRNVSIKATITTSLDSITLLTLVHFDGMVSGWPKAVPAFHTTNIIVTYAQLTDYCVNVWGLPSNPYPTYPANATSSYHIINMVIGDKFYLMVGCGMVVSAVLNPASKTAAVTYNDTWYLGDSYKAVAKIDQGFKGTVVVNFLNYVPANATATPPTPATYDMGPYVFNFQGFGALSGQSLILRADGSVLPILGKGYAILP
jgi:hypothetical protein